MSTNCATIGCPHTATHLVTWTTRDDRARPETEAVCQECGESYCRRPALQASLAAIGREASCGTCGQTIRLAADGAWDDASGACGCGDDEHWPGR